MPVMVYLPRWMFSKIWSSLPFLLYVSPSALFHLLISFLCHYHSRTPLLPSACLIHFVSSIYSLSLPFSAGFVSSLNWANATDCIVLNHWWHWITFQRTCFAPACTLGHINNILRSDTRPGLKKTRGVNMMMCVSPILCVCVETVRRNKCIWQDRWLHCVSSHIFSSQGFVCAGQG